MEKLLLVNISGYDRKIVSKMKSGKTAGPLGIVVEMLTSSYETGLITK